MKHTALFAALGALVLGALIGCGGNVTVETGGSGGDGGGGTGGNSGTTSTTGTTSTSTSTTTPTNPQSYCASICTTASQYGCLSDTSIADCTDGCSQVFEAYPQCAAETTALYNCAIDQIPQNGCEGGPEICQKESDAFTECVNGGTVSCGTDACSGGDNQCSCTGECNNHNLEVDCKADGNVAQCSCVLDGNEVGTCQDIDLSCDPLGGCCSMYFPI